MPSQNFRVKNGINVGTAVTVSTTGFQVGSSSVHSTGITVENVNITGIITAPSLSGTATTAITAGYATTAGVSTALQNSRNFSIAGNFVTATAISFDGTGNVALAATITADSIGLGTYTSGDYVKSISGTSNQITVSATSGEGSVPKLSLPSNLVLPQDVTVTRDLQVNRNLNVTGNITLGGTTAFLNVQELKIADPDIILGVRTDAFGNDISNDTTSDHGGVALASTEGTPLVDLFIAGIETNPSTYKKVMWFKSGTFAGLGTDAWLFNYGVGIGSTQFPIGTRLAAGNVQFTQNDLAVVRNINASGISTFNNLRISGSLYDTNNQVGAATSVLLSTGTGVRWETISTAALQGVQGIQGRQGVQGTQGIQGVQGPQGTTGAQGFNGTLGTQGATGTQGTTGTQGATGTQGTTGTQGATGTQGIQGITGPVAGSANQVVYKDGSNNPTSSANLTFNGTNLTCGGTVTSNSDEKLKSNIQTIANALEKVSQLRGVEFDYKESGQHSLGFIAQEVEKVVPDLVFGDDPKSVAYQNFVALLVEAIKELKREVETLKSTINKNKVL